MVDQLNPSFRSRSRGRTSSIAALACALTAGVAGGAQAASPVALGTADSFALLAGSTITNTGPTTIIGDIGLCCSGIATPGFGSLTQPGGSQYRGTGTAAATAQSDLDIAYFHAAGQAVTNTVPVDLSVTGTPANPLLPGVYESTSHGAFEINTGLTLDFQGNPNAVFIFQGTSVTTVAGAPGSVSIVNGGNAPSACNVFWQLSDETQGVRLGAGSAFKGTTMSLGASVLTTGATVEGRILTRNSKAVTLDTNTITRSPCASAATPPPPPPPPPVVTGGTPSPTLIVLPASSPPSPTGTTTPPHPGSAQISGPGGPVSGPFTVSVTGHAIAQVTFYLDGKRVAIVGAKRGRKAFKLKINPRRQGHGVHRVTARVRFKKSSRTSSTTRRLTYRRSSSVPATPRFAG